MRPRTPHLILAAAVVALVAGPAIAAQAITPETTALARRVWLFVGKLHPVAVHFPIALLVVGCALEFVRFRRGVHAPSPAATTCITLGAAAGVIAAVLGWSSAETAGYSPDAAELVTHRWLGVATAIVGVLIAIAGAVARVVKTQPMLATFRLGAVAGALLVFLTGHFGGMLVYGSAYIEDAFALLSPSPAKSTPAPKPASPGSNPDAAPAVPAAPAVTTVIFERDIQPIFAKRCNNCHLGEKVKADFSLASREDVLRGGDSGEPAVVPGKSAESRLYKLVAGKEPDTVMPPKGGPLTPAQVELIRAWIDQGAPWTGEHQKTPDQASPQVGASRAPATYHWAYLPPREPAAPSVKQASWSRNPIDRFVLARLEKESLSPSPEADRATLLRRLSLDLIGLPPTPEEIDAFAADASPDAYEKAVDRLLASPHYGERWARVWLDLARYADSHGYEKDGLRVMWPYRDWVIEAFNRDLPYDRFTIEQLAGDQLPNPTLRQLVATGFHRNTQINEEGGTDPEEFRVDAVIDRLNTTASVWLGTTLSCAQCHDHKYDPLSQKEYFQMYAFFNQDEEDAVVVNSTATEKRAAGPMVEVSPWDKLDEYSVALANRRAVPSLVLADVCATAMLERPADRAEFTKKAASLEALESKLKSLRAGNAMTMGLAAKPRETHLFIRGSFLSPGDPVVAGVPAVFETTAGTAESPARLGLARWIASPKNPLTARVQANRIWSQLFGHGIVETEDDFGIQGDAPTHPELLDWLAVEFMRNGWSQKKLLKAIVTSATYRQSSNVTPQLLEKDPFNKLLARAPRFRVEAEMIRDAALSVSGLLSPKLYGPSVFPPQPEGVWTQIYSGERWAESKGEDRYRRGLYTFARRTSPYPTFTGFDAPSREVLCTRRPRTNTPLQALTTLNDPQFLEAAGALAVRMMNDAGPDASARAERGLRLALGRKPQQTEIARIAKLFEEQRSAYAADLPGAAALCRVAPDGAASLDQSELAAWIVAANVLLNLDEVITRE